MSSIESSSFGDFEAEHEESILSFYAAEDDAEFDNIPEENLIKYQNTYRMESKNPFDETKVIALVEKEIEKFFNEKSEYDPYDATCEALSLSIRNGINKMQFERYKIVCMVQAVEKRNQGMLSVIRFLRDMKRDVYVKSEYENNNLFATVIVGAFYYE